MTDENATVEASKQVVEAGTSEVTDKGPPLVVPGYVSQEQVNGIAADARRKAYDKGRTEAADSYKQEKAELLSRVEKTNSHADFESIVDAKLAKRDEQLKAKQQEANTRYQQDQDNQAWQQMGAQLSPKVAEAHKNHADFDDIVNKVNYRDNAPELLFLANGVDNGGEVLYQLANDPSKLANFRTVFQQTPQLVEGMMKKYAAALKNQGSSTPSLPPDPLSQLSPSNVGGDDGKVGSVSDYQKQFRV